MELRVLFRAVHEEYDWIFPVWNQLESATRGRPDVLTLRESEWRDLYHYLLDHGYEMRGRYQPGWIPSWIGTGLQVLKCEDGFPAFYPLVMDAMELKSNRVVCIKRIRKKTDELEIGRYLVPDFTNYPQHRRDHCVPIFDAFQDPIFPEVNYIVMPLLRPFNDPEFGAIGEVIDFVTQLLEGMEYIHSKFVAHGDLTGPNIMMDASPILPNGWHFNCISFTVDGAGIISPLARIDHPVRYYIIDYDNSIRFQPGQSPIINGLGGRDDDVPELSPSEIKKPFDHFKLDVFTLGNVFLKDFRQRYKGLGFLNSLIKLMRTEDFRKRPTAQESLEHWNDVKSKLNPNMSRLCLRKPDASVGNEFLSTLSDGIVGLTWLFDEQTQSYDHSK